MASTGFDDRLAYLRWLRSAGRPKAETDDELAVALGVGKKWLDKWKRRSDSPDGRDEEKSIRQSLGDAVTRWLYDDEGDPPKPDLWKVWIRALRARPTELPATAFPSVPRKKAAKKTSEG